MIALSIIIAGYLVADAILFVHGYKSYIFTAKTEQEKQIRAQLFNKVGIQWDEKN